MNYLKKISSYKPFNEQEQVDKEIMLGYISNFSNILYRENIYAHFTASGWVLNQNHTKVLMVYHNIYQSFAWPGGHADGENDLLQTALREIREETGIKNVKPLSNEIFSLEAICVNGHIKHNKYVGSHMHLNLTFLFEANEMDELYIKTDENSAVKWIELKDIAKICTEEWMVCNVYQKLISKVKKLY